MHVENNQSVARIPRVLDSSQQLEDLLAAGQRIDLVAVVRQHELRGAKRRRIVVHHQEAPHAPESNDEIRMIP